MGKDKILSFDVRFETATATIDNNIELCEIAAKWLRRNSCKMPLDVLLIGTPRGLSFQVLLEEMVSSHKCLILERNNMRKIKFRGYSLTNKKWYYGDLVHYEDRLFIACDSSDECSIVATNRLFVIQENSLGQFTGLLDKNKKEIYEGDILVFEREEMIMPFVMEWTENNNMSGWTQYSPKNIISVIGNIYENPELIKKSQVQKFAELSGIPYYELVGESHKTEIVLARHTIIFFLYKKKYSQVSIAKLFNRHRTTICRSIRATKGYIDINYSPIIKLVELTKKI